MIMTNISQWVWNHQWPELRLQPTFRPPIQDCDVSREILAIKTALFFSFGLTPLHIVCMKNWFKLNTPAGVALYVATLLGGDKGVPESSDRRFRAVNNLFFFWQTLFLFVNCYFLAIEANIHICIHRMVFYIPQHHDVKNSWIRIPVTLESPIFDVKFRPD